MGYGWGFCYDKDEKKHNNREFKHWGGIIEEKNTRKEVLESKDSQGSKKTWESGT